MFPRFGTIPYLDEPIESYFTMLVLGFAFAIWLGVRWARRSELDHNVIIDLGLASLIAGVAGARILHVFVDGHFMDYVNMCVDHTQVHIPVPEYQCAAYHGQWDSVGQYCHPTEGDCFAWAKFWAGGLVWYGGLLGAGGYGIYFLRKEGFPVLKGIDMTGMVIPLGVFFGRLGCWFGGCCFGVQSDHPLAVSFPPRSDASLKQFQEGILSSPNVASLPVLPTQLMEAVACLLIAAFCMFVVHPRKRFDGQVFVVSMALYAVARFVLEFFRADDRGAFLFLSTSQWIGVLIVAFMAVLWVRFSTRAKQILSSELPETAASH